MSYRRLISALVFAAFGFCFSGAAIAQFDCNNPDFCFDWGIPVTVDNITGSSVKCDLQPGGVSEPFNTLIIGDESPSIFTQFGTAKCKKVPNEGPPLGACTFDLTWTGVSISSCTNNSFNAKLFCQDLNSEGGPSVTGTVTCSDGESVRVMNLGVVISNPYETCETVFQPLNGLAAGQLLDFTVKTKGSEAGACTGPYVSISDVKERYCNSGEPSSEPGDPDCTPTEVLTRKTTDATTTLTPAGSFDFDVRQTVNTKCQGNKQGNVNIDILGSATFDVASVEADSLFCGGLVEAEDLVLAHLFHCMIQDKNHDGFPDLACKADACPNFAPGLASSAQNGKATAVCTGKLINPVQGSKPGTGTGILGISDVNVTPKK